MACFGLKCERPDAARSTRSGPTGCPHEVGTGRKSKRPCPYSPHDQTNPRVARPLRPGRPRRTTHPLEGQTPCSQINYTLKNQEHWPQSSPPWDGRLSVSSSSRSEEHTSEL